MKTNKYILLFFGWLMLSSFCFQLLGEIEINILDAEDGIELVDNNTEDGIDENFLFVLDSSNEINLISFLKSLKLDLYNCIIPTTPFLDVISPPPELV